MLEKIDQILDLISKHGRNELTPEEAAMLEQWLSEHEENRRLLELYSNDDALEAEMKAYAKPGKTDMAKRVFSRIEAEATETPNITRSISRRKIMTIVTYITAAVTIVIIGIWQFAPDKPQVKLEDKPKVSLTKSNPGSELPTNPGIKAELLMANGKKVALHELNDGPIETQGAFKVYKLRNDLRYEANGAVEIKEDQYNTITTPRGGQFKVTLPDGCTILLDVASTIRFKVSSGGLIRDVTIKGQAYLDITQNASDPFMVSIPFGNSPDSVNRIKVTGTQFAVKAYDEDDIKKITLIDGNLLVYAFGKPGTTGLGENQQAQIHVNGIINVEDSVDTEVATGWMTGSVKFKETTTREVLSTLEKWYDIDVEYQTKTIPEYTFSGGITPKTDIESIIKLMMSKSENLNLEYDRAHRKLIVLP